jgi:hypothetical protein
VIDSGIAAHRAPNSPLAKINLRQRFGESCRRLRVFWMAGMNNEPAIDQ